ncbi:hypothetical protein LV89_00635 [Arcicella aurantiaca]|uniref:Uncharacterized protein n=2 Tax=Arcicella aurantiaca TaxID=591202 RepID=A0A316EG57_9BACT|nr:hypothetical protein LV89_00635 [Arcicella aurantiaca]
MIITYVCFHNELPTLSHKLYEIMNTSRSSDKDSFATIFVRSLFYTTPFGMFLTASNFMFEYVRKYYFDWLIVLIPTVLFLIGCTIYEMFIIYKHERKAIIRRKLYEAKSARYRISKSELVTS